MGDLEERCDIPMDIDMTKLFQLIRLIWVINNMNWDFIRICVGCRCLVRC